MNRLLILIALLCLGPSVRAEGPAPAVATLVKEAPRVVERIRASLIRVERDSRDWRARAAILVELWHIRRAIDPKAILTPEMLSGATGLRVEESRRILRIFRP